MREGAPHVPAGEHCQDEWGAGSCQPTALAPAARAELLMGAGSPTLLVPASQAAGALCLQDSTAMGFLLGATVTVRCGTDLHFLLFFLLLSISCA